jgi:hypothetical protein
VKSCGRSRQVKSRTTERGRKSVAAEPWPQRRGLNISRWRQRERERVTQTDSNPPGWCIKAAHMSIRNWARNQTGKLDTIQTGALVSCRGKYTIWGSSGPGLQSIIQFLGLWRNCLSAYGYTALSMSLVLTSIARKQPVRRGSRGGGGRLRVDESVSLVWESRDGAADRRIGG